MAFSLQIVTANHDEQPLVDNDHAISPVSSAYVDRLKAIAASVFY